MRLLVGEGRGDAATQSDRSVSPYGDVSVLRRIRRCSCFARPAARRSLHALTVTALPVWVNVPFHRFVMVPSTVMVTCQVMVDGVLFVTVRVAQ